MTGKKEKATMELAVSMWETTVKKFPFLGRLVELTLESMAAKTVNPMPESDCMLIGSNIRTGAMAIHGILGESASMYMEAFGMETYGRTLDAFGGFLSNNFSNKEVNQEEIFTLFTAFLTYLTFELHTEAFCAAGGNTSELDDQFGYVQNADYGGLMAVLDKVMEAAPFSTEEDFHATRANTVDMIRDLYFELATPPAGKLH